jgi:hypothetical protein
MAHGFRQTYNDMLDPMSAHLEIFFKKKLFVKTRIVRVMDNEVRSSPEISLVSSRIMRGRSRHCRLQKHIIKHETLS